MGRPNKYETHVKPRFEEVKEWLKLGATDKEIAEHLGVNKATLVEYKHKYPEFNELIKGGRKVPVTEIKASLYKRATGFHYSEKKTVIEYEEYSDDVKNALIEMGMEEDKIGQRKMVRVELYDKYALPDPASSMILLKHWAKDEGWTNDPQQLELKKQELELKKEQIERGDW